MKKVLISILSLLILGFLAILFSGKDYLFKALKATYLKGENSATIFDQSSFDTKTVSKGVTKDWELSNQFNQKSLSPRLEEELQKQESIAFLVIKDGKIDLEKYWGKGSIESSSNSFSMAKSIVATLIGIAMKENKIDNVFQTVGDFYPEFNNVDKEKYFNHKLEIRHLLAMKAGLQWKEDYYAISETSEAYYGSDIKSQMLKLKVSEQPGEKFVYQSAATQLLALILEKATGMTLADYASEKLWKPLGAKMDASWHVDDSGEELAFCCFNSNARDFARVGQLYLNKGSWNGNKLIPAPYIDISTVAGNNQKSYGYHWWIKNAPVPSYRMQGFLGQYVVVIPSLNIVMVRLGHKTDESKSLDLYIEEVVKMYQNS
jgi:CubicO group peptidase (beta-lactamase class C family)